MNFFALLPAEHRFGHRFSYAEPVEPFITGEPNRCPQCGHPLDSRPWLPPHHIRLSSSDPSKWGDFLWGSGFTLMISSRLREFCQNTKNCGIEKIHSATIIKKI